MSSAPLALLESSEDMRLDARERATVVLNRGHRQGQIKSTPVI
jgi:hypothetical protein